jgi:polyisoprenoid-binding protein YceI
MVWSRTRAACLALLLTTMILAACQSTPTSTTPTGAAPSGSTSVAAAPPANSPAPASAGGSSANPVAGVQARTFRIVPDQSEASYDVQEQFFGQNAPNRAIGRTKAVEGDFQLQMVDGGPRLLSNRFSVDLRTLQSDQRRRDQMIRENWLESNKFPMAEFTATAIREAPTTYVEGQEVPVKIDGNLKIREVTKPVTFDAKVTLTGDTLTGTATTFLLMKDFGFDPPEILRTLTVQDGVNLTLKFTAHAGA